MSELSLVDKVLSLHLTLDDVTIVHAFGGALAFANFIPPYDATLTKNLREAGAIIIDGEVRGNLMAHDRVELKQTARYEGDLVATKLVVKEGASFNGHVTVGPDMAKNARPGAAAGLAGCDFADPGSACSAA